MKIRNLFFETILILILITLFVVTLNSYQVHRRASDDLEYLQRQYLNATFEIYKNEIIGDVLVGNREIIHSLLDEITSNRSAGTILSYDNVTISTGQHKKQLPIISYSLNLGNEKFATIKLYPLKNIKSYNFIDEIIIPLSFEVLVLSLCFIWVLRRVKRKLLNPLNGLVLNLEIEAIGAHEINNDAVIELKQLCGTFKKMTVDLRKKAQYEAESIAAKQVAHDIRSPLACLNLLLSNTLSMPEKQRILMRSSIQRITDIANALHSKAEKSSHPNYSSDFRENIMISSLLEMLVTEKRTQLGLGTNIRIDLNLDRSYGLFSYINAPEFRRVLSNLIDNSIESFSNQKYQNILISVDCLDSNVIFKIEDNGNGIPDHILNKVGTYGFSYGKNNLKFSGSGIGIHHAVKTINSFGGSLIIDSKINHGTIITINLPKSAPPEWFVEKIDLRMIHTVVIVDDDESINNLWVEKLQHINNNQHYQVKNFKSFAEFKTHYREKTIIPDNKILFLVDFEFVSENENGLDFIEKFHLQNSAILVTSHHDDPKVRLKSLQLGVKIIPKNIVSYIPIT